MRQRQLEGGHCEGNPFLIKQHLLRQNQLPQLAQPDESVRFQLGQLIRSQIELSQRDEIVQK